MNDIPRRNRLDLITPAEKDIHDALQVVEGMGADERLTCAVTLLGHAQNCVADFVDDVALSARMKAAAHPALPADNGPLLAALENARSHAQYAFNALAHGHPALSDIRMAHEAVNLALATLGQPMTPSLKAAALPAGAPAPLPQPNDLCVCGHHHFISDTAMELPEKPLEHPYENCMRCRCRTWRPAAPAAPPPEPTAHFMANLHPGPDGKL